MEIIGYIHVCQKGQWQRSLKMLMDCIKNQIEFTRMSLLCHTQSSVTSNLLNNINR